MAASISSVSKKREREEREEARPSKKQATSLDKFSYANLELYDQLPEIDEVIVNLMAGYMERCRSAGWNVNRVQDSLTGDSLLHCCVRKGRVRQIKAVLLQNPDLAVKNQQGDTPRDLATRQSKEIQELLKVTKLISKEQLLKWFWESIYAGNIEEVQALIEIGGLELLFSRQGESHATALHVAAGKNFQKLVEFFLEKGLEVDGVDAQNRTPLFYAALEGHDEMMWFLLTRGSGRNMRDIEQRTPLHYAAIKGHLSVVKILSHSADRQHLSEAVEAKDRSGKKPINLAKEAGHMHVVEYLADY